MFLLKGSYPSNILQINNQVLTRIKILPLSFIIIKLFFLAFFLIIFFFLIWRTYILPPTEGIIAFSGFDYYSQDIGLWPRVYQSNTWAKTWNEQLVTQTSGTLIALSLAETKFLGNLVPGKQWLAVMLCFLQFFYFPQLTCLLYVLDQCHS